MMPCWKCRGEGVCILPAEFHALPCCNSERFSIANGISAQVISFVAIIILWTSMWVFVHM